MKNGTHTHTQVDFFEIFECHISKDNIFQDVPIYFLIFFEVFWHKKSKKYGVYGPRNDQ